MTNDRGTRKCTLWKLLGLTYRSLCLSHEELALRLLLNSFELRDKRVGASDGHAVNLNDAFKKRHLE